MSDNESLVRRVQEGNSAALEQLYYKNIGLIRAACNKYGSGMETEDLEQECFFAVNSAAHYFQEGQSSFAAYLWYWLRHTILRYREASSSVHIPAQQRELAIKYDRIMSDFQKLCGRDPSERELAVLLEVGVDKVNAIRAASKAIRPASLDKLIDQEEGITLGDTIADGTDMESDVITSIYNEELAAALWSEVNRLSSKQSEAIRAHYQDGKTFKEIGDERGITAAGAECTVKEGVAKLRRGKSGKRLRQYLDIYSEGVRRYSVKRFQRTGYSVTEVAAFKIMKEEQDEGQI